LWGIDLTSEATQVAVAKIVAQDHQKIGGFLGHGQRAKAEQNGKANAMKETSHFNPRGG
jgi:hypothetical protein